MARETHIVRFKVVAVECSSLPNGQQYTIMYHRGSTTRSTPCYTAQNGIINFAAMPEGAAEVHFKSGHGGVRFAPKYVRFMMEEYTRGMPRRLVGETEVDVTQVLKGYGTSGAGILTVVFRLYGTTAKMRVAVLAYTSGAPPLSFDGLIDPADVAAPAPPQTVKTMNRGEAMMILMGLETLLDRRRTLEAAGQKPPQSREEQKLAELEERRKALVGSEGLAAAVVRTRCEEVVAMQFTAVARSCRNNFIGQTAAYLREMALRSGEVDFNGEEEDTKGQATTQEQLNSVNHNIEEAEGRLAKLQEERTALERIKNRVDVSGELSANEESMSLLQSKITLLSQSRDALATAVLKQQSKKESELAREVRAITERIQALEAEQKQLQPKAQHMIGIGATHVVKWARSKNPPEPEPKPSSRGNNASPSTVATGGGGRTTVDDLFADAGKPEKSKEQKMLDDVQRRQVVDALKGMRASAPPPTGRSRASSSSSASSSGHRTPRDLFANQPGLPSMGDFSSEAKKKKDTAAASAFAPPPSSAAPAKQPSVHEDPLRPSGLGMNMFSASSPKASSSTTTAFAPSAQEPTALFDFSAMVTPAASSSAAAAMGRDTSPGFVLEPQSAANMFAASPSASANAPTAAPAATVTYNKKDDPYYDEMDDFTVQPESGANDNPYASVEFTGGFTGFGEDTASSPVTTTTTTPAAAAAFASSTRPTFDFAPSTGGGGFSGGFGDGAPSGAGGFGSGPAATFTFGGNDDDNAGDNNNDNRYSGVSNLPTYNFGS